MGCVTDSVRDSAFHLAALRRAAPSRLSESFDPTMLGLERSLGGVALVVFLASAYSQHSAHEHLVGALDRRIALLEKQAGDLRAQEAGEMVLLRGVLERLTIAIETAQAHDETAQAAQTETEDMAQVRHLRHLLVLSQDRAFDLSRAFAAGFTFEQVLSAVDETNCPRHQCLRLLKQVGYTEVCTESPFGFGLSAQHMIDAGCTEEDLAVIFVQLKTRGASFDDAMSTFCATTTTLCPRAVSVLRMAGYSCADAHAAIDGLDDQWSKLSCQEQEMNDESPPCAELSRSYTQTLERGRSFCLASEIPGVLRDLRQRTGLHCGDAVLAGYSPADMTRAGYSMQEIAQEMISAKLNGILDSQEHNQLLAETILKQLKAAGMTCKEARHATFRPRQCKAAGYTYEEAKQAGYAYFELHWNRGDETESVHHNGWDIDEPSPQPTGTQRVVRE